ncbi:hypothetical protein ACRALDRAFT_1082643 [Sodiomyces alcalophilus JCM 7366]|uniref:uncharacterized protein n=1 Tax=Sodiomyces alcalophilus JCM 7366 TaxID=591952 RepID=UPI0039B4EB94
MEPPAKRPRLSLTQGQGDDDDEDELLYEPEEVSRFRDPGYQLEESRAFAAFKLKSTFEHIFAKYERDFTGIGDEIDLRTGKVVVDNGHIQNMQNERDVGQIDHDEEEDEGILLGDYAGSETGSDEGDADEDDEDEEGEEEHRILRGQRPTAHAHAHDDLHSRPQSRSLGNIAPAVQAGSRGGIVAPTRRVSQGRLSTAPFALPSSSSPSSSYNPWGWDQQEFVDPAWRAPPLQPPGLNNTFTSRFFNARYNFPAVDGSQSVWSSRRRDKDTTTWVAPPVRRMSPSMFRQSGPVQIRKPQFRKLLPPPPTNDDDDEDELLGLGTNNGLDRMPATGFATASSKSSKKKLASQKGKKPLDKSKTIHRFASGGAPHSDTAINSIEQTSNHQPTRDKATSRKKGSKGTKDLARPKTAKSKRQPKADQRKSPSTNTGRPKSTRSSVSDDEWPGQTETRTRRIEIVLPSRLLTPDGYTDLSDFPLQSSPPVPDLSALPSPPLPEPEAASPDKVCSDAPREEEPSVAQPLKATFTRHEVDKSYEFSGDEEGIPMCRLGRTRPKASETRISVKTAEAPFRLTRSQKRKYEELIKDSSDNHELSDDEIPDSCTDDEISDDEIIPDDPPTTTTHQIPAQEQTAEPAESTPEPPSAESGSQDATLTVPAVRVFSLPVRTTRSAARRSQQEEDAVPTRATLNCFPGSPEDPYDTAAEELAEEQQHKSQTQEQSSSTNVPVHAETIVQKTQEPTEQECGRELTPESQDEHPALSVGSSEDQMARTAVEWLTTLPRGSEPVNTIESLEREPSEPATEGNMTAQESSLVQESPAIASPVTTTGQPESPRGSEQVSGNELSNREPSEPATEEAMPAQGSSPFQESAAMVSPVPTTTTTTTTTGRHESPRTPATVDQDRPLETDDPSTPQAQPGLTLPSKPSLTSIRRGLLSLQVRPGDDDGPDEICPLSLSLSSPIKRPRHTSRGSPGDMRATATPGSLPSSARRRRSTIKPKRVVGSLTPRTPRTLHATLGRRSPRYGSSGGFTKQASGSARFRIAREGFGGLSTPTRAKKTVALGSPTGSIIQTPGGHMRRCGVDGFTCERDFCFTCLQG